MTEDGAFRFKRLVFGVNCAPELFQRLMCDVLVDCEGVLVFIDDILIHAKSQMELHMRTEKVLAALKANNLTLNPAKCQYNMAEVDFLGHRVNKNGINIDETKVEAIRSFREPRTVSELKSFLGLATFVSAFIPNYATLTGPLWEATKDGDGFRWGRQQRRAFRATKEAIAGCTITQGFYSTEDETILFTDASPRAAGCVLTQRRDGKERIIAFASKTFTETERRYPQTQREALAIVWAVEHFFYYLLGREFTIKTDAAGIAFILKRTHQASKRVMTRAEGWALRLSAYRYKIETVPGKLNIADPSSRLAESIPVAFDEGRNGTDMGTIDADVSEVATEVGVMTLEEVREATATDTELQSVREGLQTGRWKEELLRYKVLQGELYENDSLLMRADRVVVPRSLRSKALAIAHEGHPGMTTMRRMLRERIWWPKMDREAEEFVKSCLSCTLVAKGSPPPEMLRTKLPQGPWEKLAIDFCGPFTAHGGILILVVADYHSRFIAACVVKSTDHAATTKALSALFELYGFPRSIRADNGPPFQGAEFRGFCEGRGVHLDNTIPYYPQHNGMVERYMQLVGKAMKIAWFEKKDFRAELAAAVRAHNQAPHSVTGAVPEQLMLGRIVRRNLPMERWQPGQEGDEEMRLTDWANKMRGKAQVDGARRARSPKLVVGDEVVQLNRVPGKLQTRFASEPLTIVERVNGDLKLQGEDGRILRRHTTHVKKRPVEDSGERSEPEEVDPPVELRRSTRARKPPAHASDYVKAVDAQEGDEV